MMTVRLGAHVDQVDPIAAARSLGATLSQFFLGNPQGWKAPTVAYAGGTEGLRTDSEAAGIALYVHAPYVLNVATTNNRVRIPSRKLLQQTMSLAEQIGAAGVIVHGGHVSAGDDPAIGFDNWRKCIDRTEFSIPLLIENTAGGEHAMARRLERIEQLWEAVQQAEGAERVGLCLDTCHAHAGGLEMSGLVDRIRAITGRIDLIHANDSRDPAGSGADRHTNLGQGQCDPDELAAVVRDAGAPVVVETPGDGHLDDLAWLRDRLA